MYDALIFVLPMGLWLLLNGCFRVASNVSYDPLIDFRTFSFAVTTQTNCLVQIKTILLKSDKGSL